MYKIGQLVYEYGIEDFEPVLRALVVTLSGNFGFATTPDHYEAFELTSSLDEAKENLKVLINKQVEDLKVMAERLEQVDVNEIDVFDTVIDNIDFENVDNLYEAAESLQLPYSVGDVVYKVGIGPDSWDQPIVKKAFIQSISLSSSSTENTLRCLVRVGDEHDYDFVTTDMKGVVNNKISCVYGLFVNEDDAIKFKETI